MIELTRREVSMLELLHRHAGKPVSRDAFLDACWGLDYFPDSRTLDQHVLMLRKKIEADPARPEIIETVRGTGYRFKEC
jgi:DNA-binding response OmpR family regulator